ncbi:MAG: hypothetical protein HC827_22860 [Cyanobacteria bacterium RM1_2_2]|nr:hypothetical protein [Cyanobacteria bacterium RM1_2_2]
MTSLNLDTPPSTSIRDAGNTNPINSNDKFSREAFVSWLFLIGSLMFVLDAILENMRGVSFSSLLHLLASVLFTIGSVLFIPAEQ